MTVQQWQMRAFGATGDQRTCCLTRSSATALGKPDQSKFAFLVFPSCDIVHGAFKRSGIANGRVPDEGQGCIRCFCFMPHLTVGQTAGVGFQGRAVASKHPGSQLIGGIRALSSPWFVLVCFSETASGLPEGGKAWRGIARRHSRISYIFCYSREPFLCSLHRALPGLLRGSFPSASRLLGPEPSAGPGEHMTARSVCYHGMS